LWSAGLWLGAIKNGERRVTTGQYQVEFRPGRTELDRIYRTRELAPGGAREPAPNADDDRDGKIDEDWLDAATTTATAASTKTSRRSRTRCSSANTPISIRTSSWRCPSTSR
jgi:hypothetical protein